MCFRLLAASPLQKKLSSNQYLHVSLSKSELIVTNKTNKKENMIATISLS